MADISNKPWSGDASDYGSAATYCNACLINTNGGAPEMWSKANCHLPIKEPDGTINSNGAHAAAAVLAGGRGGVDAPLADRQKAASKLVSVYGSMNEQPPESLTKLAG